MAYRQVTREELEDYLSRNPGASYRVNGQEYTAPTEDSSQSGLMKILTSLTSPFRMIGGSAYSAITGKEKDNPFLTQAEELQYAKDPTIAGTKAAIGLGAYLMPVGAAAGATTAGARIGSAALRGITPGAMGSYALSKEGKELESILSGAGLGAVMGGGLQAVGEGVRAIKGAKLSNKLSEMSDDLKTTAYKKKIGMAPTAKQGKYDLVRDSMNLANKEGRKITSAEDLYQFSDELFGKYGTTADDMARTFDDMGGAISVDTIKKPILEKLASVKTPELKAPYQSVLNSIDEAVGSAKTISAKDLLQLRREWGNLGNWNQLTPTAEQATAKAWEQVYKAANNTLDDTFTRAGMSGFKDVNQKLSTAIEQQNWARRAMASRSGQQVWTDMAQDAVMFGTALGGGPGSIAGFLGTKALQSQGENIAAKGLDIASKVAAGTAGIPKVLEPILQAGQKAIPAVSGLTQIPGAQPVQQQQVQQSQAQAEGINAINLMLAQGILNGQISASEANAVLSLLGMGGTTTKLTEKQKMFKSAGQTAAEALNLLESGAAKTGKIQGVGTAVGKFFGTQDPAQTEYLAKLDGARMAAISALSGANVPPSEYERMRNLIPEPNDEYNVAVEKLRAFQQVMDTYAQSYGGTDTSTDILQTLGLQ